MSYPRFPISFDGGQVSLGVRAGPSTDLPQALRGMGLTTGVPTIVLVTGGSRPAQLSRLGPLLEKVVVPVVQAVDATVVDEGRRSVLAVLLAEVRARKKAGFPLLGVVRDGADHQEFDAGHTHFVLVPADDGPSLARWVAAVATAVAGGNRALALVAAGGEPAWDSVAAHVGAAQPVLAVARSGGVADHLAAAVAGRPADRRALALAASGQVGAIDPGRGADHVADLLRTALTPTGSRTEKHARLRALGPGPTPQR